MVRKAREVDAAKLLQRQKKLSKLCKREEKFIGHQGSFDFA